MPSGSKSTDTPEFAAFWALYPRRTAKGLARKEFAKALTRATATEIMAGLKAQIAGGGFSTNPKFIPHPSTWLHQDRWEDDVASAGRTPFRNGALELLMRDAEAFGTPAIEGPAHG